MRQKPPQGLTAEVLKQRIAETERELTLVLVKCEALSALLVSYRRIMDLAAARKKA